MAVLFLVVGPEERIAHRFVTIHVDNGVAVFDSDLIMDDKIVSALDALKLELNVQTEKSTFGEYITCIANVCQIEDKAWFFYINDEMAQVGAGEYLPKDGDRIDFVLRNY